MTLLATLRGHYTMRSGSTSDQDGVVDLIRARSAHMRQSGHGRWASWERVADELGSQMGDPRWPSWVLVGEGGRLVGITTATFTTPTLGWTEQDQRESAVFLQSTVTHPDFAGAGLGVLIAFWALDHAARHGKLWVRRGVITVGQDNRGLVRYYRLQGWRVLRTVSHPRRADARVWSLQRPAQRQPNIGDVLRWDSTD